MAAFDAFGASSSIIPHPAITEPKLYISGIPQSTTDTDLADVFRECLRARFIIERAGSVHAPAASGYVEFEHLRNAEKAYATLQGISLGANTPPGGLTLSAHPPSSSSSSSSPPTSPTSPTDSSDPKPSPSSIPRIIKQLPPTTTPAEIFELFRIFGPLYRISIPSPGRGRFAVVEYYEESHTDAAASEMNFTEIGGNSIIVEKFDPRKPAAWANANAQAFVPGNGTGAAAPKSAGLSPTAVPWSPPVSAHQAVGGQSMHAPGAASQHGGGGGSQAGRGSNQHWDPCNLFIKNLDPSITSQDLFINFKGYGKIVSARVMRHDATGESKEFGFVSFEKEEDAARALQGMDGIRVRNRTIVVRFHEPKKYREARIRPTGAGGSAGGSPDRDLGNGLAALKVSDDSGSSSPHMSSSLDLSSSSNLPQTGASVYAPSSSGDSPALPSGTSERERLLHSVRRIADGSRVEEIVELLLALPKKERAMALFSEDVLAKKVADAKEILDSQDDDDVEPAQPKTATATAKAEPAEPVTPAPTTATATAAATATAQPKSLEALGGLPATEIVASLKESRPSEVEAPAPADVAEMDEFVSGLEGRPSTEQKQKLGDRLFKAVKACGVKGAPKITIHLLDTEDLRALGHLMLYPEALKAKVLAVQLKK